MINAEKLFYTLVLLLSLMLFKVPFCLSSEMKISAPIFIAHAGGAVKGLTYTNSLEAFNASYEKGYRFFEVDFSWTSDREIVAIHDWEKSFKKMFFVQKNIVIPTEAQFLRLKSKLRLTQLSLNDVLRWAEQKKNVFIVTDIKNENLEVLEKIPLEFRRYIIPQAYTYQEYAEIIEIGYSNVILTLYKMNIDHDSVLYFSKRFSPFAITMHWSVAQSGLAKLLFQHKTRVYAHTVNDINLLVSLRKIGVYGIYTGYIVPP